MLIDVRGYSTYMKNCDEIFQGIPSNPLQACFCCIISTMYFMCMTLYWDYVKFCIKSTELFYTLLHTYVSLSKHFLITQC